MNLDNVDFEAEWDIFKSKVGGEPFNATTDENPYINADIFIKIHDAFLIKYEIFKMFIDLGLVIEERGVGFNCRVNPAELCSMSEPSIHYDKEGLRE